MSKEVIAKEDREIVERILGRRIDEAEWGHVGNFSDFTETDLQEFRIISKINSVVAGAYIRHRLNRDIHIAQIMSYRDSVVEKNMPFKEWEVWYKGPGSAGWKLCHRTDKHEG